MTGAISISTKFRTPSQPVWGVLGLEFKELYKHLETSGNKYWKLAEIVVDKEAGNSNLCIVFPTKIQADVFKEELLIEYGWSEYDSNVRVGYLGDMVNYSVICEEVVLPVYGAKSRSLKYSRCFLRELPCYLIPQRYLA